MYEVNNIVSIISDKIDKYQKNQKLQNPETFKLMKAQTATNRRVSHNYWKTTLSFSSIIVYSFLNNKIIFKLRVPNDIKQLTKHKIYLITLALTNFVSP